MVTAAATRSARRRLLDFFAFEPGEVRPTLLLTAYLLLAIASVIALKAASKGLYLHRFDARTLPYVYVAIAVVVGFVVSMYIKLSVRLPQNLLLVYTQLFFASHLLLFWALLRLKLDWIPAVIIVWTGVFAVILPTQVWTLANHIFTTRQARRLFSIIGSGGILGAALGGQFNGLLATRIGTERLLLTYVPFLFACAAIVGYVWRTTRHLAPAGRAKGKQASPSNLAESARTIRRSPYLSLITVMVLLSAILGLLVDYQFTYVVREQIPERDRMTAFFSHFYSYLAVFSLMMHLLLTSRVMRWFGLNFAIFVLPFALLLGSTILLLATGLLAAALIKGFDQAFRHSIDRSSTELLYVPLPVRVKQQAKSFIDMVVIRWADGLGGLLLILLASKWHWSVQRLSVLNLAIVIPWLAVAWKLRREYVNTLRSSIERKDISAETLLVELAAASSAEITTILLSADDRAVETGLGLLRYGSGNAAYANLGALLTHMSPTIRRKALSIVAAQDVPDCAPQVAVFLFLDKNVESLWEALDYLERHDPNEQHVRLRELLEAPHAILRATAAARLLARADSPHRPKALEVFTAFVESARKQEPAYRQEAAELLGLVPSDLECQAVLADFLEDPDLAVVRAAAISAGRTRQRMLLYRLVELTGDRNFRSEARQALTAFGAEVLPTLNGAVVDSRLSATIRRNLPRVFSAIGGQEAADYLVMSLDLAEPELRHEMLRALSRIRLKQTDVRFDPGRITPFILGELRRYYRHVAVLQGVPQNDHQAGVRFLRRALNEQLSRELEAVFRLLGLLYPAKDIFAAYYGMSSGRRDLRANALEFLDSVLLNPVRQILLPIIEDRSPERIIEFARSSLGIEAYSHQDALRALLSEPNPWLQSCAVYAAAEARMGDLGRLLEPLLDSKDAVLQETVRWALERSGQPQPDTAGSAPTPPEAPPAKGPSPRSLWKI